MSSEKHWLGHPAGLQTLSMTEVWERGSYYGMRAILVAFMSATVAKGGLGFSSSTASLLFGLYGALVYLAPLLGGFIADRFLGPYRTVIVGAILIMSGHILMALMGLVPFFGGLLLIALGTGLLKPNITTLCGRLYEEGDPRRTAGFAIMYCFINVGAAAFPILCGAIAGKWGQAKLAAWGFDPMHSWHWAFAAAGVGMFFGLVQLLWHANRLRKIGGKVVPQGVAADGTTSNKLTQEEWHKLYALGALFVAFTLFCAISEQAGSSLERFAEFQTRRSIFGIEFESAFMLALNPVFVIFMTPVFNWLWDRLRQGIAQQHVPASLVLEPTRKWRVVVNAVVLRWVNLAWFYFNKAFTASLVWLNRHCHFSVCDPSSPKKFSIGLSMVAIGAVIMVPASLLAMSGLVSPWWLFASFFFQTVAELLMSPVGNAAATALAPKKYASLTMAVWFLSIAAGSAISGVLASFCDSKNPVSIAVVFGGLSIAAFVFSAIFWKLTRRVESLMGDMPAGGSH